MMHLGVYLNDKNILKHTFPTRPFLALEEICSNDILEVMMIR